jgi:ribosomal protein S27AE
MDKGEKPEMKILTYGAVQREHSFAFDETVGLAGASDDLDRLAAGGVKDDSLHADGKTCPRCGVAFNEDTPVRRIVTGAWVHDMCPTAPKHADRAG